MNRYTLAAFQDEMEKIALGAEQLARITAKGASRGWSGGRVNRSIMQLSKREGNVLAKNYQRVGVPMEQTPRSAPWRFDPSQSHKAGSLYKPQAASTLAGGMRASPKITPSLPMNEGTGMGVNPVNLARVADFA